MSAALDYLVKARPEALGHYFAFLKDCGKHLDPKTRNLISVITKVDDRVIDGSEALVAAINSKAPGDTVAVIGDLTSQHDLGGLDASRGLAVIMRYTLRLLTVQQFERTEQGLDDGHQPGLRRWLTQRLERRGQVAQHGGAHLDGVEAQDTVERLVAVVGVQRGQAQMARLCIGNGGRHGFTVADFADQDHVRRLAQGILQGRLQRLGVAPHFALVHDGLAVAELVFHRVFDGQDMAGLHAVAPVDHGGQRGALARSGRAHHQNQPALFENQVAQHGR